ncbi:MAG: glycosyltransferase family 1 protein [Anaerolineaceae bacterium]|nr:glycosyltransferase family 1 protein [Anaerolineaceae bacterium]
MRIALLGTRGIPASYSGFETCVEQLGQRLVERGHEVTVYCRPHYIHYPGDEYLGMRLVKLPTIPNKYLDTLVHTFLSSLHALRRRYDVAVYFIAGNSPVTWIPHLVGTPTILNVDGLDWRREKWPPLAKRYIQWAARMATRLPTVCLADSREVQAYYREQWGAEPVYIPYGSEVPTVPPGETLARFGLEPRQYVLFVGRLVPENSVHHLVRAFRELETDVKCAIVGDASYAGDYIAGLKAGAEGDPRIVFTGYVFGAGYHELGSNAYLFVETSGVGGTHPALLEAMAFGNCVVVNGTPENLETIGDAGLSYDGQAGAESLRRVLADLLRDPDKVAGYRSRASRRVQEHYSWETVTDQYERLFYQVRGQLLPERLRAAGNRKS